MFLPSRFQMATDEKKLQPGQSIKNNSIKTNQSKMSKTAENNPKIQKKNPNNKTKKRTKKKTEKFPVPTNGENEINNDRKRKRRRRRRKR